jgi:hypothetical protein
MSRTLDRLREGFAVSELLSQKLVLRHIHGGADDSFQRPIFDNRSTNAPDIPNFAVGSDNTLRDITSRSFRERSLD